MAVIVYLRDFPFSKKAGMPQPIIYTPSSRVPANTVVSLSIPLAEKLTAIKPKRRAMRLEQCFRQVLDTLPDNPVIRDFDVLFNPVYEVDILHIMESIGKSKPFQVIWPGKYEDGRLFYAEEGYRDYKAYDLNKYNVTCII